MKTSSLIAVLVFLGVPAYAPPPAWWSGQGLIGSGPVNNYAPANVGQLKNVAKGAKAHLDASFSQSGGAGPEIDFLVSHFSTGATNYQVANLGQLKMVAKPFYDRLFARGYNTRWNLIQHGYPITWESKYPWADNTAVSENYRTANLGQLKMVFSFDARDNDANGLFDEFEERYFGSTGQDPDDDPDGDGLRTLDEYRFGTNPLTPFVEDTNGTIINLTVFTVLE
jgi:hypothetical protein